MRKASIRHQKPIAIFAALQGPKIRTGELEGGKPVQLHFGQRFTITSRHIKGTAAGVSTTFQALPAAVSPIFGAVALAGAARTPPATITSSTRIGAL